MMFCKHITKNKVLEIQLVPWSKWEPILNFNVNIHASFKGDHPGFFFCIAILKFLFEFNIYDTRHEEDEHE